MRKLALTLTAADAAFAVACFAAGIEGSLFLLFAASGVTLVVAAYLATRHQ